MAETKLYLNIQEQVEKNKNDIKFMLEEEGTLNKFGIKVIGQEDDVSDMPSVADYKEEHEDWAYGDAYAIGTEAPYTLYILTRANGTHPNDYWFNIGQFPVPGPQGETGEQGPAGHTPQVTVATPVTSTLPAGSSASASVMNVGTADDPQLAFSFSIPKGDTGATGAKGDPGAFHINGQVANASLLPDASLVDADAAYAVGTVLPYDVYVIMTVNDVQSWLNLGPVLTEISDTYDLGVASGTTSGTLSQEQYDALVNDNKMNFLKIGVLFFVKIIQENGVPSYVAINNNILYKMNINSVTLGWSLATLTFVDLSSAQTITGEKTTNNFHIYDSNSRGLTLVSYGWYSDIEQTSGIGLRFGSDNIAPTSNGNRDLGSVNRKWREGFINKITDANGSYSSDNVFNVINASDIVNNTLTQDQYDLITNGKPTLISGTLLSKNNAIWEHQLTGETSEIFFYRASLEIGVVLVNKSTRAITYRSAEQRNIRLQSVDTFNGKSIPAYPSNTGTFVLKCVDGVLTWVAE